MSKKSHHDIAIIGAGVVGSAIARELSKYQLSVALIEKNVDVGLETSCRNSGVIHSGIHYKPGTSRAKLNVRGNEMMAKLCDELNVKYEYCGKLTIAHTQSEVETLKRLLAQGIENGVTGLKIIDPTGMQKIQPGVKGVAALHSPSTGIINPYGLTIALAENAQFNGVDVLLEHKVKSIKKNSDLFSISCSNGVDLTSKCLINASGLNSDVISNQLRGKLYTVYPCRGEYYVLDKRLKGSLNALVYPVPGHGSSGLGIHLTNTVDGNILIGPSNEYIPQKNDYSSTREIMKLLVKEGHKLLPGLSTSDFIRSFSGIRPKLAPPEEGGFRDFVIEKSDDISGFINLVGIESPGLTSSPAIAQMVRDFVGEHLKLVEKNDFCPTRPSFKGNFNTLSPEEKTALIHEDSSYGEIICRCEKITKREVLDAINNPLGTRSIVSIKYRARVMMGRCQGGFCLPKIISILENEFGADIKDYIYNSRTANLFSGRVR